MKNDLSQNIWKFYVLRALSIPFIAPIRILYLLLFGLTFSQVGMMELAAAVIIVLLEIPTGVFADITGRKNSRLISYVLSLIAFALLSGGSIAIVFIIAWAFSGAADAFESGAQDALIYDTLKKLNRENSYAKIKSHFLLISTITTIVGAIGGSYLYSINPRYPWIAVTITIILSMLLFLTIKEPAGEEREVLSIQERFSATRKSLVTALKRPEVLKLLALGIVLIIPMYVFTTLINQPYLLSRGYTVASLGFVFAGIGALSGFFGSFSHLLEKKLKKRNSLLLVLIAFSMLWILMGSISHYIVLLFIVAFFIMDNFKSIILDNYLNQTIESTSRASVLSAQSFLNNIVISVLFVFIGYLVDHFGMNPVMIGIGVLIGIVTIPVASMTKRKY